MRPLDPLASIKLKLGAVIVAAVIVTIVVVSVGVGAGFPLWACGLAAGALALAMIQFLARGMTSPLREMVAAAQAMARGDYERHVTATSRDEVGELARAFNRMAAELAEVERMRRDLIANVSHELRTPISALQAVLENIEDGVVRPEPESIRAMLRQVERLGGLVSQLLDLSKLESGAVPLQQSAIRINQLMNQVVDDVRLRTDQPGAKSVLFSVRMEPQDLVVRGDAERLHQVLVNLVDNAVRHSPPGGTVTLTGHRNENRVAVEVLDEGPGIPEEEAARVFDRFYRLDHARTHSDGGSGLGLSIARWIVDLHGGDIRAEPRRPHGCRMVVELPTPEPTPLI
jgi:signal transduction histidine kinase